MPSLRSPEPWAPGCRRDAGICLGLLFPKCRMFTRPLRGIVGSRFSRFLIGVLIINQLRGDRAHPNPHTSSGCICRVIWDSQCASLSFLSLPFLVLPSSEGSRQPLVAEFLPIKIRISVSFTSRHDRLFASIFFSIVP